MQATFNRLFSFVSLLLIASCSPLTYDPQEYSLRDKLIRDFEVSGNVTVTDINMPENPKIIYSSLFKFESSYQKIAQLMAKQLEKEIIENSTVDGNLDKQLYIQLDKFYIEPGADTVNIHMNFTLLGERGFEKQFSFNTPGDELSRNDIEHSFDNAIALAVKKILYNGDTLNYLAKNDLK